MRGYGLAALGAAIGLTGAAPAAVVLPYSSVIVFGDSLVDAGNAQIGSAANGLPDPAPSGAGYFDGRFSNGYNFADRLSEASGKGFTRASEAGGLNYSVGGALALERTGDASPSFIEQLGSFSRSGRTIASDALVLVTFGGNDVRATSNTPGTVSFDANVATLRSGLNLLLAAGARNIVVTGLPDIGSLPEFRSPSKPPAPGTKVATTSQLTRRSNILNNSFRQTVEGLATPAGANVGFFNLFLLQKRLESNPVAFGLPAGLNTTTPCIGTGRDCDGYLFFDVRHPTSAIHSVIADQIAAQITSVPEPQTWAMLIAGIGMVGGTLRRRRRATTLPPALG